MKHALPNNAPNYQKRIVRALRQLSQKLDEHSRQLLIEYDITMPQIICLDELNERGAMTVTVLANCMHLSPSTAVGIIDRLAKKELVTRTRDVVDRRSVFIEITDAGRKFISSSPHLLHNKLQQNLSTILEDERIRIANSLDTLLLMLTDTKHKAE